MDGLPQPQPTAPAVPATPGAPDTGWWLAVRDLSTWSPGARSPVASGPELPSDRTRHRLVRTAIQHWGRLAAAVEAVARRRPRPLLQALLVIAGADLLTSEPALAPAVVHHAVEQAKRRVSAPEVRFLNATLRALVPLLTAPLPTRPAADAAAWAQAWSHPAWLVRRWLERWGEDTTAELLAWNQREPQAHLRWLAPGPIAVDLAREIVPGVDPAFLALRPSANWGVVRGHLAAGRVYVQDPATRHAPALAAVQPGETVLDLCASPGGKTLLLAEAAGPTGAVVAVDLPGPKARRLADNLRRLPPPAPVAVFASDVLDLTPAALAAAGHRAQHDVVLLDAPCSNTGVLRHKPDVKWRLQPEDLVALADLQLALLDRAAACTAPAGRLIYSTCSLEEEENKEVVAAFLGRHPGWSVEAEVEAQPWRDATDGAYAARLRAPTA